MTPRYFSSLAPIFIASLGCMFTCAGYAGDDQTLKISGAGVPPVMRNDEAPLSAIVTLPGPPPEPVAAKPSPVPMPLVAPTAVPAAAGAVPAVPAVPAGPAPNVKSPAKVEEARPLLRRTKRDFPAGFEENPAKYLQDHIGQWKEFDVPELLGRPLRHRPSFDESGRENGTIYTFADPTGHYKDFELDFAGDTDELRTVFIYPVKLTWQACREKYGTKITTAEAQGGRKFYSYLDRRLDVLVDANGNVISLGFY